jgi:3-oxoacyl-[acyl-carrier-protein] synthase II
LKYAQGLLNAGRAVTALCGAVEEYSNERSWLDWHTRGSDEAGAVLGEGCAMLQLESSGDGLAEILAVELGVFAQQDATAALTACVRRALAKAGVDSSDVWAVCPSGAVGTLGTQEQAVVMDIFTGAEVVRIADLIGDTSGAAAIFQVVTLLAMAAPGQVAVVTSVDRDGETGAAVLRLK